MEVKQMRKSLVVIALAITLVATGAAFAGIPSASTSTVEREGQGIANCNPDITVVCPASDFGSVLVTVTVRNVYGDPLPDKIVDCYPNVVSGTFCFCPGEDSKQDTTDANGQVFFTFSDFGGCGDLEFGAECEGVIFNASPTIYIASFDNNGDCTIGLPDFINFANVYGTADACSDYNCDGTVGLSDFISFANHYGHSCP